MLITIAESNMINNFLLALDPGSDNLLFMGEHVVVLLVLDSEGDCFHHRVFQLNKDIKDRIKRADDQFIAGIDTVGIHFGI